MSLYTLGLVARRADRYSEAAEYFESAIAAKDRQKGLIVRGLHAGLADCLARLGREADAEREFPAEIAAIPYSREARVGLALLYRSQGRDAAARGILAGVVTQNPRAGADEYFAVVRTLAVLGDTPAARDWASRARALHPADPRFR